MKPCLRPTAERRKADVELIFKMLRKNKAAEYSESINPFEQGSVRFARFERIYKREQSKWHDLDALMDDLAQVYGEFRPDKLASHKDENISKTRKILSWIPMFGAALELCSVLFYNKPPYLSDITHNIRFNSSFVYHGVALSIIFIIILWSNF